jgi:O-acetyl-ADP-ribose deacetylase (regulator of RNase III)
MCALSHGHKCVLQTSRSTLSHANRARFVAHTVGPRYNAKYRTAAESALFNCYRGTLQVLK